MKDKPIFDAYIISAVSDFDVLKKNIPYIKKNIPAERIFIVAKERPSEEVLSGCYFLDENSIIDGMTDKAVSEKITSLGADSKHSGWYLQQFIKLGISKTCEKKFYLVWDCDTIPLHQLDFFDSQNRPYFNLKREYKARYFTTIKKLLALKKKEHASFISEHMLFDTELVKELIQHIEDNASLKGTTFWKKILFASLSEKGASERNFSEFETYGTFIEHFYPQRYAKRKLATLRYGSEFFGERPEKEILAWCSKSLDTISFEKHKYEWPPVTSGLTTTDMNKVSAKSYLKHCYQMDKMKMLRAMLSLNKNKYRTYQRKNIIYEMDYIFSNQTNYSSLSVLLESLHKGTKRTKSHENIQSSLHSNHTTFKYDVSVIIVNYNTRELLKNCLDSLYAQTKEISFEVLVSDNGSKDGSLDMVKTNFPQVKIIDNNENLGFGAANNRGLAQASGKYIFYLNSDTVVINNAVKIFFDYWESHKNENIGALGANLLDENNATIHSAGKFRTIDTELKDAFHDMLRTYKLIIPILKNKKMGKEPAPTEKILGSVDYVTGADLFVKNDELAWFDERYFLYYEETDMQKRMALAGKERRLIEGPQIQHLKGGSDTSRAPINFYKGVSKINSLLSCCIFQHKHSKNPIRLFLLKLIISIMWLNPALVGRTEKYLGKLWRA